MEEADRESRTQPTIRKPSSSQSILMVFLVVVVVGLAVTVVAEGYFYLQLLESHTSLQMSYDELQSSYQALNTSFYELLVESRDVSVEQAKTLIETKPDLVVVDVRFADEYEGGHIEGAINLCVVCYPEGLEELDLNAEILVYCRTGARSTTALRILIESGHFKVYNMIGGIVAWEEAGYSIVTEE